MSVTLTAAPDWRALREARGLRRREVAKAIRRSEDTLAAIECGHYAKLGPVTHQRLCAFYGLPLPYPDQPDTPRRKMSFGPTVAANGGLVARGPRPPLLPRSCKHCGATFRPRCSTTLHCSRRCTVRAAYIRYRVAHGYRLPGTERGPVRHRTPRPGTIKCSRCGEPTTCRGLCRSCVIRFETPAVYSPDPIFPCRVCRVPATTYRKGGECPDCFWDTYVAPTLGVGR